MNVSEKLKTILLILIGLLFAAVCASCTGFGQGELKLDQEVRFYNEDTEISLTLSNPYSENYRIYYTLDGTSPRESKTSLEKGETIHLTAASLNKTNAFCIRAAARYPDGTWSNEVTRTYFLGERIQKRFDMKVISLTVDQEEFYGSKKGIYTFYEKHGSEWEIACYFELMEPDGTVLLSQKSGIRIHGGASRSKSMKSLRLYARKEYDEKKNTFDYPVFEGAVNAAGEPVTSYKRLLLRNSGNDFNNTFVRDAFAQRLARQAGFLETEENTPAAVFINGVYQGMYWIQEYVDEYYFESKFGPYQGTFEKSEHKENAVDSKEENLEFLDLAALDLTDEANFAKVRETIDLDNYILYYAINTLLDNEDWPQTNSISYRYVPAKGEPCGEGVFDGRWRFMIHDDDMILGLGKNHPTRESLKNILDPTAVKHHSETLDLLPYSPLFAALMEREDMRQKYIDQVAELVNGVFSRTNMTAVLNPMLAANANELRHYFSESPHRAKNTMSSYSEKITTLRDYIKTCGDSLKKQITELWGYEWPEE